MASKGYQSSARTSIAPGAYYEVPAAAFSNPLASPPTVSYEPALPTISANETADYDFIVPNTAGLWKVQKAVDYMCPDGTPETAGIVLQGLECIAPVYPGTGEVVSLGAYIVLNQVLYVCTTSGTTNANFIGAAAFKQVKGQVTVDGTCHWTSVGRAVIVRAHFANVLSGASATPAIREYDLFQF